MGCLTNLRMKRLLIHASAFNLGLAMRHLIGIGTPRGLHGTRGGGHRDAIRAPGRRPTPAHRCLRSALSGELRHRKSMLGLTRCHSDRLATDSIPRRAATFYPYCRWQALHARPTIKRTAVPRPAGNWPVSLL